MVKEQYKALQDHLRNLLTSLIQDCIDHNEVIVKDARKAAQLIYMMVDGAYFYLSLIDNKRNSTKNWFSSGSMPTSSWAFSG